MASEIAAESHVTKRMTSCLQIWEKGEEVDRQRARGRPGNHI